MNLNVNISEFCLFGFNHMFFLKFYLNSIKCKHFIANLDKKKKLIMKNLSNCLNLFFCYLGSMEQHEY
jgi:hypothetical protein